MSKISNIKLDFGQFIIKNGKKKKLKISNISEKSINDIPDYYIANPLSQTELAEGWKLLLPKNKNIIHHFTINLLQLPSHLWKKIIKYNEYDFIIKDRIYEYSIIESEYNDTILNLYYELFINKKKDYKLINELYDILIDSKLKGWLLEYTKNIIIN